MNGFADKGLDESQFGPPPGALAAVSAFDAFPKTKASYTERSHGGGVWTVVLVCASALLTLTELRRWWAGDTTHAFSVEQGVGHDLQINLDVVVAMKCDDLHVNVQDASGDRILAGMALSKDLTMWRHWDDGGKDYLRASKRERLDQLGGGPDYREEDVHDYLGAARKRKKFPKTPRIAARAQPDACRIYGSLHGNKVQGDFHITARGHGYREYGEHLSHDAFNFSHTINELSFGPFYPSLTNPLDNTVATTDNHFHKFQYYVSVVPTIYTTDLSDVRGIDKYHESPSSGEDGLRHHPRRSSSSTVFTNQYAVTEQSHPVPENGVPGVFVKFDIEPILLTIAEEWVTLPALLMRLVNVVSGVLVAGGWFYQLAEWVNEVRGARSRRTGSMGMLNGGMWNEKRDV